MANTVDNISVAYDSKSFQAANASISINLGASQDIKELERFLTHEIGHRIDEGVINKMDYQEILRNIPNGAYKEHAADGNGELFAELYALLHLGHSSSSDYTIATYFSEQVEPVKRFIENKNNKRL